MEINGTVQNVEGALVIAPCDTLAAHWIGGFKQGVGFALKACRQCSGSSKDIRSKFNETDFMLCNETEHRERCQALGEMSVAARKYWSKLWGINSPSCLLQLDEFPLCMGLVQDLMHLLLEGVLPHELKLMLHDFIMVKKYFTLVWLNSEISSFQLTDLESSDKPQLIEKNHITDNGKI